MSASQVSVQPLLNRLEGLITPERVVWLLSIVIFLVAWNRGLHLLYVMFAFLISALLISYIGAWWQLKGVKCQLQLAQDNFRDTPSSGTMKLEAAHARYLLSVAFSSEQKGVTQLSPINFDEVIKRNSKSVELSFNVRGLHTFNQLVISSYFPFGLVRKQKVFEISSTECLVYPKVSPIRQLPEQILLGSQVDGDIPQHQQLGHDEFAMVRQYREGDEMRNIHWRMSAKHNDWIVKEFDSTKMPAIAIVLNNQAEWDLGDTFSPREHMLDIVASLADKCAQSGCGLCVVLDDQTEYQVKPFQRDLHDLWQQLALWNAPLQMDKEQISQQLQSYPLVIDFNDTIYDHESLTLLAHQRALTICFDVLTYPNLGVNAAIKKTQGFRNTQLTIGSSTAMWGIFG